MTGGTAKRMSDATHYLNYRGIFLSCPLLEHGLFDSLETKRTVPSRICCRQKRPL